MTTKKALPMLFLCALIIALTGCTPTPPPPPSVVCVDFEPPLLLGNQFGPPAGQNPGDLAFPPSGIPVTVWEFQRASGAQAFGFAQIDPAPAMFGNIQIMNTNNINLEFDFSQIGFQTAQVDFEFLDLGGIENISVDGNPSPPFAGELTAAPNPIGATNYIIAPNPVAGGKKGTVILEGAVTTLRIGGQEFWIDNVCAREVRSAPIFGCADFGGYPDDTTFGNPFNINGYQFTGVGAAPFVNKMDPNVVGLQFAEGLEVDLPGPVSSVTLDVASFSQQVDITALDSSGKVVANATVPGNNTVQNMLLAGQDIVKITLTGGNGEGVLVKICT